MISRFPIFFLLLFCSAVFPWLILIFKSEKQLLTLAPATLEQEEYLFERNTGKSFDSPDDYAAYISETGGDAAKALKVADTAVPEWEAKNNTRAKARQPLLKLKRNVDGEPAYPHYKGGAAANGKAIYQAQGCFHCHTQQVRQKDFGFDIARGWGQRRSVARDYIYDSPVLIGRHRIGPDLANIGTRLDPNDLHKHIYRPPHGSNMPAYPYLYKVQKIRGGSSKHAIAFKKDEYGAPEEGYEVVPKPAANDLVKYLTGLRQDYELPEARFYPKAEPHHGDDHSDDSHVEEEGPKVDPKILSKGKKLYNTAGACVTCYQPNGQVLAAAHFPPLAGCEWVTGSEEVITRVVLNGIAGPIKVAGKDYGLVPMVPTIWVGWSDDDIAAVLTYIRNEWGNEAAPVTPETVGRIRSEVGTRGPWTDAELEPYK